MRTLDLWIIGGTKDIQSFVLALNLVKPGDWEPGVIAVEGLKGAPALLARTTVAKTDKGGD